MVVCPPCTPDGDFGLVDENLVLGYAVFLNQSDIELLASKHGSITHHAGSIIWLYEIVLLLFIFFTKPESTFL
jgi:hypothetical protein